MADRQRNNRSNITIALHLIAHYCSAIFESNPQTALFSPISFLAAATSSLSLSLPQCQQSQSHLDTAALMRKGQGTNVHTLSTLHETWHSCEHDGRPLECQFIYNLREGWFRN